MNTLLQTSIFSDWLRQLKDYQGKTAIIRRITRAQSGNFGDCKPVGSGVQEMRIPTGPGYRVYYLQTGDTVYLLLVGGDKGSQKADIQAAQRMAADIERYLP